MEITLNKKSSTEATIKISLKEADYQPKVEQKVKEYSKKADIKGFRKGHVPTGIIKNLYGKSILVDEINHMISHGLNDYINENKLNIIGEPLPNREQTKTIDWETQSDFDFEYNIGLVDEFELDLTKKQKINKYEIKVDKKVIDKTVNNLKEQYGDMTNPEVSEEGDSLYGSFTQAETELSSNGVVELKELGKKEGKKFVGLKKGDKVSFDPHKVLSLLHKLWALRLTKQKR